MEAAYARRLEVNNHRAADRSDRVDGIGAGDRTRDDQGKALPQRRMTKVNCAGSDGNSLDVTNYGERIFYIDRSCVLWQDTGDLDEIPFPGSGGAGSS